MSASILVAYATRYGSTQETAEAIAAALRESGFGVDLQPLKQVRSIEGYRAIVIGAPLQLFRWHGDARRFLSRFRQSLTQVPVAVFALGPIHHAEKEMQDARGQLDKELAKHSWLAPVDIQVFVGRLDPAKLRFPFSLTMKQVPAVDEMDLTEARAWAAKLPAGLGLAATASAAPMA